MAHTPERPSHDEQGVAASSLDAIAERPELAHQLPPDVATGQRD